jgi:hypothetical protein
MLACKQKEFEMKRAVLLMVVFALSSIVMAQTKISVGTVIPVQLSSSIDVRKAKPGQTITARVAQDVPLYNGESIKAGSRVMGKILTVTQAKMSQPATLTFSFDKVEVSGQVLPIVTNLRALASPLEVESSQTQTSGDDRGSTPPWAETVTLIGGDVAYRETGKVNNGLDEVGKSVYAGGWGVLSRVGASPEGRCRGALGTSDQPQALWVFSHNACGVYGYNATIVHSGRSNPEGTIVLALAEHDFVLGNGSALLLRVNGERAGENQSASK